MSRIFTYGIVVAGLLTVVVSPAAPQESFDKLTYLTFSAPVRTVPDLARLGRDVPAAAYWTATLSTTETGEGFLEISWRKDGAA